MSEGNGRLLPRDMREAAREPWAGRTGLKLDLGSGDERRDVDFVTVDKYDAHADVCADLWELPFADGSASFLWSSHALEHVESRKIHATLREWLRILEPGGKLILQVPDFNYVARYWLVGPDRHWAEMMVYGRQSHEGDFHKTAFTAEVLRADLEAAGFVVERVEWRQTHSQETLQAVAHKPPAVGAGTLRG